MDRREFLKKSLLAGAGTVIGAGLFSQCTVPEAKKKIIGLQLYSLRDAMKENVPETLKKVAQMGYSTLETAGYGEGSLYGFKPADFKKMVNDLGMKVTGAHLGKSLTGASVTKPFGEESEKEVMEWWQDAFEAQAEAGCSYVVQPSFPIGTTLEDIKLYCDYFNQVGALAKTYGLRFGFHNHAKEFEKINDQVIYDYMLAQTDPTNVMFELDVYWAVKGGVNPVDYIEKYKGRIPILHIKDEEAIGESGTMDFESIFNAANQNGMEAFYVEVERYSVGAEEDVKRSFDYLQAASYVK